MFKIRLAAWRDALDAYRAMELFMTEKMDAQYAMLDALQDKWYGAAAFAFRRIYTEMLEHGKYAQTYRHVRQIRHVLEDYLPKLVNLASKCEQLPEQLDYDVYSMPWNTFSDNIHYNYGYLYFDEDYVRQINQICDIIEEQNRKSKELLDDIMKECEGLIDFSEEKEMNEKIFRKINRIQNFRMAFNDFAAEIDKLDEEIESCFRYITAQSAENQETQTVVKTAQKETTPQEITDVEQAIPEPSPESGWNALIESFMDSWLGEGVTAASTVAGTVGNPIISQALCYKTYIDVKYRNMTLEESLQETEEFAKGYVQSVPKVVGETVQDMIELPPAIMELPDTIYAMWQLIEEYGAETVASGILESTKERIETAWNEEVVNGTARSRGEMAGRVVLVANEVVLSVKGLAEWLVKGKKVATKADDIITDVEKVEKAIEETQELSDDIKDASKVIDEVGDAADDAKSVEKGVSDVGIESSKYSNGKYTGGRTEQELKALAEDPAHSGSKRPIDIEKGQHEAKVGLELEERGFLKSITRDATGKAEFIDGTGQAWDVKSFNSNYKPNKGGYRLDKAMHTINKSLSENENVIIDTSNMSPEHIIELTTEIKNQGLENNILFWP